MLCKGRQVHPSRIETERLTLSPLSVIDADEMVSVLADDSLYEFTGGEPPTLATLQHRYRHQVAGSTDPEEFWANWILRTKPDGRAVGFVQATVVGSSAAMAWVVGVGHQRRGLATEAATALREWLAGNEIRHVEAHIHPHHASSQAVARRVGLIRTGRIDGDGEEIWATADGPSR